MSMRVDVLSSEKDQAIQEIKEVMKTNKYLRMHKRYQVILMVLHAESYEEIASVTGRSKATLYNYSNAYRLNGLAGLDRGHPPDRKSFLTPEEEHEVYQMIVHQNPVDVGFPLEMNWTSPLIRKWIKQTFRCVLFKLWHTYATLTSRSTIYQADLHTRKGRSRKTRSFQIGN